MRTITLAVLQEQVRQQADERSAQRVSDDFLTGLINASAFRLHGVLAMKYGEEYRYAEYRFATAGDTETYALPSNFYKLLKANVSQGSGSDNWITMSRFMRSEDNRLRTGAGILTAQGETYRYALQGDYIALQPVPNGNNTIKLSYVPTYTPMSASADTFDGINGSEQWIVYDVAAKIFIRARKDPSMLLQLRAEEMARIEAESENRDAGSPARMKDVYSPEGWDIVMGGWRTRW